MLRPQRRTAETPPRPWTASEDRYLNKHANAPVRDVAEALGRTTNSVVHRRSELRVGSRRAWTATEDATIRAGVAAQLSDYSISVGLDRTEDATRNRRARLGLRAARNATDDEILRLFDLYWLPLTEQAKILGRSRAWVSVHRLKLGLVRL